MLKTILSNRTKQLFTNTCYLINELSQLFGYEGFIFDSRNAKTVMLYIIDILHFCVR